MLPILTNKPRPTKITFFQDEGYKKKEEGASDETKYQDFQIKFITEDECFGGDGKGLTVELPSPPSSLDHSFSDEATSDNNFGVSPRLCKGSSLAAWKIYRGQPPWRGQKLPSEQWTKTQRPGVLGNGPELRNLRLQIMSMDEDECSHGDGKGSTVELPSPPSRLDHSFSDEDSDSSTGSGDHEQTKYPTEEASALSESTSDDIDSGTGSGDQEQAKYWTEETSALSESTSDDVPLGERIVLNFNGSALGRGVSTAKKISLSADVKKAMEMMEKGKLEQVKGLCSEQSTSIDGQENCQYDIKVLDVDRQSRDPGPVILVRNTHLRQEWVEKPIYLSQFSKKRVDYWRHLEGKNMAPKLFSILLDNTKIIFNMEYLKGKTLQKVISESERKFQPTDARLFALLLLKFLLKLFQEQKCWRTYEDIQGSNVFVLDGSSKAYSLFAIIDFDLDEARAQLDFSVNLREDFFEICRLFLLAYSRCRNDQGAFRHAFHMEEMEELNQLVEHLDPQPREELFDLLWKLLEVFECIRKDIFSTDKVTNKIEQLLSQDWKDRSSLILHLKEKLFGQAIDEAQLDRSSRSSREGSATGAISVERDHDLLQKFSALNFKH